eukprot:6304181-Amphidinium_carterae.4
MPPIDSETKLFKGEGTPGGVTDSNCLMNFPTDYQKSPFVLLTYASEFDRALEYQPLVVREIAHKASLYDLNLGVPEPILMHEVVRPDNCESYLRDDSWPLASLTIANGNVTQAQSQGQFDQLWNSVPTLPDVEMSITADEEAEQPTTIEEVIYETEADRVMSESCAAASTAMEVDEGSLGSTFAGESRYPETVRQLPERERQEAPSSTFAGDFASETLAAILKQEGALEDLTIA